MNTNAYIFSIDIYKEIIYNMNGNRRQQWI